MQKKLVSGLLYIIFVIYIVCLLKIILFKNISLLQLFTVELSTFRSYNVIPFQIFADFKTVLQSDNWLWGVSNILGNVVIFIPLGLLLPSLFEKMRNRYILVIITVISISVLLEASQYAFSLGSADIDDVLLNTAGGGLGIFFYFLIARMTKQHTFIIQCVVLIFVMLMSVPSYYVAKIQFGSLLGLTNRTTHFIGNENIPTREADGQGSLVRIDPLSIEYYQGFLSDNEMINGSLEKNTVTINGDTKIFVQTFETDKTKDVIKYTEIKKSEFEKIKQNTNIRLWLQQDQQTADVIVIWESFVVDGDSSILQETVKLEQKEAPKKNAPKVEIEGIILNINGQDLTINLSTTQELEDGSTVAFVGLGKNIVKYHVKLNDNTNYIKRTSTDMGKTYTDAKATKEDLAIDQSLHITGVKQGEEFIATSIIIYEFK
ncbi:VanZ family protein [Solibacillus sp. CAU 1738]|uniref:VanZ family protein n=1 Tax=Solibacillus sp. CAU 1738 TaxID=3140363 RepID=UPI00326062DF